MNLEISKNELDGALAALGKLVSRTSPQEAYRSVQIEGKEDKLIFRTANGSESLAFSITAEIAEPLQTVVLFDDFRTAVKCSRNKALTISVENGNLSVEHQPLRPVAGEFPATPEPASGCEVFALPAGFVGLLAQAAPVVNRNEFRRVLQGIHLCRDGIVATNGKELLFIESALELETPTTIPFPLALLASRCDAGGTMTVWRENDRQRFIIALGPWTWSGMALPGNYPNWRPILPDASALKHVVCFDDDRAAQLALFLKSIPADPPNNPVSLTMDENRTTLNVAAGTMRTAIAADFPMEWGNCEISVNRDILSRLLRGGHRRLSFSGKHGPFLATGGIGTYVAMPLYNPQTQPVQPNQEEKMNENPHVGAVHVPPVATAITPEPVTVNPLDELAAAVDDFKTRIRAMFDESALLARKVKEVALAQKQKERDFVQAKRAIERIRMAI